MRIASRKQPSKAAAHQSNSILFFSRAVQGPFTPRRRALIWRSPWPPDRAIPCSPSPTRPCTRATCNRFVGLSPTPPIRRKNGIWSFWLPSGRRRWVMARHMETLIIQVPGGGGGRLLFNFGTPRGWVDGQPGPPPRWKQCWVDLVNCLHFEHLLGRGR